MAKEASEKDHLLAEYDTMSVSDTDTLSNEGVHTPTSTISNNNADINSELPVYEKLAPAQVMIEDVESGETKPGDDNDGKPHHKCRKCKRKDKRRRCKGKRIWFVVLIRVLFMLWALYFVGKFVSHGWWKKPSHFPFPPESIDHDHEHDHDREFGHEHNRHIIIGKDSSSIWGKFPLYDLLSLSTTSGTIAVTVIPQPADPEHPDEPARLHVRSKSGNIVISFAVPAAASLPETDNMSESDCMDEISARALPARPYEIDIETEAGSISGRFIFSSSARLESRSGDISVVLIPIVDASSSDNAYPEYQPTVSLETVSSSGSQHVRLAEPYLLTSDSDTTKTDNSTFAIAEANHITELGSLFIAYPHQWAGNVHAQAESGSVSLKGRDLEVVREEDGAVDAVKSRESVSEEWWGGRMNVSLGSEGGSVLFYVG